MKLLNYGVYLIIVISGNLMAGNFLAHAVTFRNFMAGKFLGGYPLVLIPSAEVASAN